MPTRVIPRNSFTLGNMLISSCPGKKVRLTGPIKGRGSVCRDLGQDLRRMKDLGVACIICCLDDEELAFLGVSWADYASLAEETGIDVLRVPIPEGLAPRDAAKLDADLTTLIQTYTLRGLPLLVHCRGGVGRAGLVACCWMLKLGLCGWIETELRSSPFTFVAPDGSPSARNVVVRRDTMRLVERVISVVRRRRSPKAIETFEQVKFLVDYVEYLRSQSATSVVSVYSAQDWDERMS